MSAKISPTAEQDDAAFRARLAPLASEVLPASSAAGTRTEFRPSASSGPGTTADARHSAPLAPDLRAEAQPGAGRRAIIVSAAAAGTAALGAVWLFSKWPWFNAPVAAPVTASTPPSAAPSEAMIGLLLRRGDAALADGDIVAARLLYERAAAMGSAKGATSAGKTYDIDFLSRSGARGIRPDQTAAATWFRKAAALGDPEARSLLARIEGRPQP
jgi:TPR repeat protein